MLRPLGALLLLVGAAYIGFSAAGRLHRRAKILRVLLGALEQLERELRFRLTPLPELLADLAAACDAPVCDFFARCAADLSQLGALRFGQIWRGALAAVPLALKADELQTLAALGDVLGQYDSAGQGAALARTRARLEQNLAQAEADSLRCGRLYGVLGLTAGAFLVIFLL